MYLFNPASYLSTFVSDGVAASISIPSSIKLEVVIDPDTVKDVAVLVPSASKYCV